MDYLLVMAAAYFILSMLHSRRQIIRINALRSALRPFAEIGTAFVKNDPSDNSEWVRIPDNQRLRFYGWENIPVSVGQFRAARLVMTDVEIWGKS